MPAIPQTPTTGEAGATAQVTTLLGRGSEFEGKLAFEGTVRVDGKLSGEIFTEDVLIVGEGAEVNAEISVGSIVIQGTVRGNIVAKRGVEIHTPGRVRGNINTPRSSSRRASCSTASARWSRAAPHPNRRIGPRARPAKRVAAPRPPHLVASRRGRPSRDDDSLSPRSYA